MISLMNDDQDPPNRVPLPPPWRRRGPRVLIAEDEPLSALLLQRLFDESGFHVVSCTTGRQAVARLCLRSFDLIVTDWHMPDMDGRELLVARRANPKWRLIPTLVLSSTSGSAVRDTALGLGASWFLPKPYCPVLLIQVASRLSGLVPQRGQSEPAVPFPALFGAPGGAYRAPGDF